MCDTQNSLIFWFRTSVSVYFLFLWSIYSFEGDVTLQVQLFTFPCRCDSVTWYTLWPYM